VRSGIHTAPNASSVPACKSHPAAPELHHCCELQLLLAGCPFLAGTALKEHMEEQSDSPAADKSIPFALGKGSNLTRSSSHHQELLSSSGHTCDGTGGHCQCPVRCKTPAQDYQSPGAAQQPKAAWLGLEKLSLGVRSTNPSAESPGQPECFPQHRFHQSSQPRNSLFITLINSNKFTVTITKRAIPSPCLHARGWQDKSC